MRTAPPVPQDTTPTRPEPLCDTREAAAFLARPVNWLQRNAEEHGIPRYLVGREFRYRLSELAAWVDAHAVK